MSPICLIKQQGAPKIDPGTYTLELLSVREVQVDDFDHPGQKADRIELTFAHSTGSRSGTASSSRICARPRLGPRSKLGQIMTALNGGSDGSRWRGRPRDLRRSAHAGHHPPQGQRIQPESSRRRRRPSDSPIAEDV